MANTSSSIWTHAYAMRFLVADRRLSIMLLLYVVTIILAVGAYAVVREDEGERDAVSNVGQPLVEPRGMGADRPEAAASYDVRDVKPLSVPEAMAINAAIPTATAVGSKAQPFVISPAQASLRSSALECLTAALYYEAASESDDGQRAVGQVILNRMRHPAYPPSVCGVVYQGSTRNTGCQFTFTCDGSLSRVPSVSGWARSRKLAEQALAGRVYAPVGHSTHYHANYVVPYWAASLDKTATIGRHIFYRWKGRNGTAPAFRQRYAQVETIPIEIASAVLAEEALPAQEVASVEDEGPEDDRPALPDTHVPSGLAGERAASHTPVTEDKREQSSLLADQTAGTLKLPAARRDTTKSTTQTQSLENLCLTNRKVAPIAPSSHARVPDVTAVSTVHCS